MSKRLQTQKMHGQKNMVFRTKYLVRSKIDIDGLILV